MPVVDIALRRHFHPGLHSGALAQHRIDDAGQLRLMSGRGDGFGRAEVVTLFPVKGAQRALRMAEALRGHA